MSRGRVERKWRGESRVVSGAPCPNGAHGREKNGRAPSTSTKWICDGGSIGVWNRKNGHEGGASDEQGFARDLGSLFKARVTCGERGSWGRLSGGCTWGAYDMNVR